MFGRGSSRNNILFNDVDWFQVSSGTTRRITDLVNQKNADQLLNTSTEDLARYIAAENSVEVPTLDRKNITVDQREVQIDVSNDRNRYFSDRDGPHYLTGTAVDVVIPFVGDEACFRMQPTTYSSMPPRGEVSGHSLKLTVQGVQLSSEDVQREIDSFIISVEQYLTWLRQCADQFNPTLYESARSQVESRKKKLLADRNLVAGLGFKMRERSGEAQTYTHPTVRRRLLPPKPSEGVTPYKPEPILEEAEYQHILKVLSNMVQVMELSPGAFSRMDEESLRTHFLVQLNGHYEGGATGETFNFDGKTDILIKADGRNIFIAECKFWKGEKGFSETIDQLLGYVSWRDTKAAILVFNRNKDFTDVVSKVFSATLIHENCKKLLGQLSETSCKYLFSQREDVNREMTIAVQVYNVPDHVGPRISTV